MANNNIGLSDAKLAQYLNIALKQRQRAANKFVQDYGPESATVQEINREIGEMQLAIATLSAKKEKTPLETAIAAKK